MPEEAPNEVVSWRARSVTDAAMNPLSDNPTNPGARVIVGMSGGVDSSVAAALLTTPSLTSS